AAARAERRPEGLDSLFRELCIPVGRDLGGAVQPAGIHRSDALLKGVARLWSVTREAVDLGERAVQLDDPAAPRRVVQTVDVLRDDPGEAARIFKPRERVVACIRSELRKTLPSDRTARPVAYLSRGLVD